MEEPGEQCTVVFTLAVTEPASECVCVCEESGGGSCIPPPFLPLLQAVFETIYAKTSLHCSLGSSMFGVWGRLQLLMCIRADSVICAHSLFTMQPLK
jgi:hypothetical protein